MTAGCELTVPVERRATYHDPCRLNKRKGIHREPREIMRAIPGPDVPGRRPRDAVGLLLRRRRRARHRAARRSRRPSARRRVEQAAQLDVDLLVSACVWSERPLAEQGGRAAIEVCDLMELVAHAAGLQSLPGIDVPAGADDVATVAALDDRVLDELAQIVGAAARATPHRAHQPRAHARHVRGAPLGGARAAGGRAPGDGRRRSRRSSSSRTASGSRSCRGPAAPASSTAPCRSSTASWSTSSAWTRCTRSTSTSARSRSGRASTC